MSSSLKAPRYGGFKPSSKHASRVKSKNRKTDTKAELILRRALWARGLRYRVHGHDLPGKPDIVFLRQQLAVFVDGDFWHGRDWEELQVKLARRANPDYWIRKIAYNRERDQVVTRELETQGWTVMRVWEGEILSDVERVAEQVMRCHQWLNA
ncbi:MAG: very short patch repair endonuclease [Acidobacteriota bacterium]